MTKTNNLQDSLNKLRDMLKETYGIDEFKITVDERNTKPCLLTFMVRDKDGIMICVSKTNEVAPMTTDEQYSAIVLESGAQIISRIGKILVIHH